MVPPDIPSRRVLPLAGDSGRAGGLDECNREVLAKGREGWIIVSVQGVGSGGGCGSPPRDGYMTVTEEERRH
jgi:hypothetical protein